jgi:hypothetical protein
VDKKELIIQFIKTGVKTEDLKSLLETEIGLKKYFSEKFVDVWTENKEFMKELEKYIANEKNCKKIFGFIKDKTTPKQVFVYPIKDHLKILKNVKYVVEVGNDTKFKPTVGEVWIVENGNPKSESWKNLNWEKNGQLIEVAGIVGQNSCFYPFERPTNNTVTLKIVLDRDYMGYRIGLSTHIYNLHNLYTLIIGKFIYPDTLIPIFFYDSKSPEGKKEMDNYFSLWYKVFKDNKSKELYGCEILDDQKRNGILSMIRDNEYKAGDWRKEEQKMKDPIDYIWEYEHDKEVLELGSKTSISKSKKEERGQTDEREFVNQYDTWRCEGYERY